MILPTASAASECKYTAADLCQYIYNYSYVYECIIHKYVYMYNTPVYVCIIIIKYTHIIQVYIHIIHRTSIQY